MRRFIVTLFVLVLASTACSIGGSLPTPTSIAVQPTVAQPPAETATTTLAPTPTDQSVPVPLSGNCTPRTEWQSYTVVSGDTLSNIAARTGTTVNDLVTANCLANSNVLLVGQQLRVPTDLSSLNIPQCTNNVAYFFTFTAGAIDRLCPNPADTRSAAGEDFEGGRMLWYAAAPTDSDQRPTIYVIYNDGDWETIPDIWTSGQPSSDPNIVPPANRFQPVDSFGKVWRENAAIKQRLGWAYEQKQSFTGHFQTVIAPNPRPSGYVDHWYLDHGKQGIVLRLYSVDMAPNRWEVAGKD